MRRLSLLVSILVLLAAGPAFGNGDAGPLSSVRIVDVSGAGLPSETLYASFTVLDDLGGFLAARPEAGDAPALAKLCLSSQVVTLPQGAGDLFVVSLRGLEAGVLEKAATVLFVHDDVALVAAAPAAAARLERPTGHFGLENGLRRLSLDRIQPGPAFTPPPAAGGPRAADPRIFAMVAGVSAANLQATTQDLQDMNGRYASSGAFTAETYLVDRFNAIGGLNVTTHQFSTTYADNVIADLPGTVDPSVIYAVGGHYDSITYSGIAYGADDNASGTAGVLEIARILSQYDFKYTLRFCCFNAEELGLVGSEAYCDWLVSQGANVAAYINLDMTAYRASGDALDVDFVTNYSSNSLIDFCIGQYQTYVPGFGTTQGSLSGGTSDHQSFTQHGYTACFPFEDLDHYSPYIHSSNDIIGLSANDFVLAQKITQGVLAALAELAAPVDLEIVHTPLADTSDAGGPYAVIADVRSLVGSNVAAVTLHYDAGSGYQSKSMVYTGNGDAYISSIPGQATARYVKYYLEAEDDLGYTERLPAGMDADAFQFFAGHFNDVFADDFEVSDNGWTHGGTGDDWQRGAPLGNGGYDPSAAYSGTKVRGNDVIGDGNYGANVNNWLESPAFDCTGKTGVVLRYRRWLTVEKGIYDQAKILVNNTVVWQNDSATDHLDTSWVQAELDISAYADNNPSVKIRFTLKSDGGLQYGGWNIDDLHVGSAADGDFPNLFESEVYFLASTGGTTRFFLNGPPSLAGRVYVLALSASGTSPGTQIGTVTVPLNQDTYTNLCLQWLNSYPFTHFMGTLNAEGDALATFNAPVIVNPALIGRVLHFAWLTIWPADWTSDPVPLLIAP